MKSNTAREALLIAVVLMPFVYLATVWDRLPEQVPMHWNLHGEVDRYGSKIELLLVLFVLPVLMYLIMLAVPYIDPKKRIQQMGGKWYQLKFILVLFTSALAMFIVYTALHEGLGSFSILIVLIGLMFAALGNYFQSIKPNYFVGIRTPWTLENEAVWRKTHKVSGWLWLLGGLSMVAVSFIFETGTTASAAIYGTIFGLLVLVPIVYSYVVYRQIGDSSVQ